MLNCLVAARMLLVVHDPRYFGDHIATALDFDPIADLHAQAFDFIHVMKRGAADGSSADGNRLQHRNRREFAGAAHLHEDVFDLGHASAGGVLVGDGPARSFAGVSQFVLQCRAIDLDYDAVDFVGQGLALGFLLLDEAPEFVEAAGHVCGRD